MQRRFISQLLVGTAFVLVTAVTATSALAASSNRGHFAGRAGIGIGGPAFGMIGGPGFGMMGGRFGGPGGPMGGMGFGGPGGPRGGAGGILGADVLTPAAAFLGVSLSTLQADLKGGKTLTQEATAKGKTASALIDALVASEKTVLDSENAAGWLTDAQETSVLADLKDAITNLVSNGPPVPEAGHLGPLDTAATYLGMTVSDLQAALQSGKTLADEAAAKGKTVDGLVQALLAPLKTQLDKRVTAGDITAAQETTILNDQTTHLTDFVNGKAGTHQALKMTLGKLFLFHR
jgi:D-Tyr-tRNAtyr deacylase